MAAGSTVRIKVHFVRAGSPGSLDCTITKVGLGVLMVLSVGGLGDIVWWWRVVCEPVRLSGGGGRKKATSESGTQG